MPLNCSRLLAIAFFSLALSVGFADVVPISISQQGGGSGSVFICVVLPIPCAEGSDGDSFSSPLGGSGQATVSVPFQGSVLSAASTEQTSAITASKVSIDLSSSAEISGQDARHASATVSVSNDYSLEFDLTSPSVAHLTGSVGFFPPSFGGFSGAAGDAHLILSGPQFQFEKSCGFDFGTDCFQTFDSLFTLDPGIYTLQAIADGGISGLSAGGAIDGDGLLGAGVSLNTDFTAVPEPYWTPFVAVLLLAICAYVARRNSSIRARAVESAPPVT